MTWKIGCLIPLITSFASFYMMITSINRSVHKNFFNMLDNEQQRIYKFIKVERLRIYLEGLVLGLFTAILWNRCNMPTYGMPNICIMTLLSNIVTYMYYTLKPKSTYMVNHLKSVKQNRGWMKVYNTMKKRHAMGILLGILGSLSFLLTESNSQNNTNMLADSRLESDNVHNIFTANLDKPDVSAPMINNNNPRNILGEFLDSSDVNSITVSPPQNINYSDFEL